MKIYRRIIKISILIFLFNPLAGYTFPENFGALHTPTENGYAVIPEEQGYYCTTKEIPRNGANYMPYHRMLKETGGNASRDVSFNWLNVQVI